MKVLVKQVNKELFTAGFSIICEGEQLGSVFIKSSLWRGNGNANIEIKLGDNFYILSGKKDRKNTIKTYKIKKNGIEVGEIYFLPYIFDDYCHQHASFDKNENDLYVIGFGEVGEKCPVYREHEQIGLILKDNIVIDDMHNFKVVVKDTIMLESIILSVVHLYVAKYFKSGVKKTKYWQKKFRLTTNKELLSKYDKKFEELYGDWNEEI